MRVKRAVHSERGKGIAISILVILLLLAAAALFFLLLGHIPETDMLN